MQVSIERRWIQIHEGSPIGSENVDKKYSDLGYRRSS